MRDDTAGSARLRILVAGGAGFIGSHLCETLLDQGHEVVCIDNFLTSAPENVAALKANPRFSLFERDICDPVDLPGPFDRIYNLACAASPKLYQADPVHTMMTSVGGVHNLLALAEAHGARLLQASTSEVYGDPEEHPQRESYVGHVNCTGPRACYDEGKRAAETMCFDMHRLGRADARVARIFNTYGPRMQPSDGRIVSNLIVQALSGKPLTIYGTGRQTRSFCYVSDLVLGLVALMEVTPNPGQPVNLGNPGEIAVIDLARMILLHTRAAPIEFHILPEDDPRRRCPDVSLAKRLLGWSPMVNLPEGLALTVQHFRDGIASGGQRQAPRRALVSIDTQTNRPHS